MNGNSQRNGNLHLDRLVQDRIGASARRWEQEIEKELKQLSGNTTKFVGDAQSSIFAATEQSLSRISGSLDRIEKRVRSTESNLARRWLLPSVLSALLVLTVQGTVFFGPDLTGWLQERRTLSQVGAEIMTGKDGRRWIMLPIGTEVVQGDRSFTINNNALFIRMAED